VIQTMNAHASTIRRARPGAAFVARDAGEPLGIGARAATQLLILPLRLLASPTGRRLTAVAVLALLLGSVVSSLYDHADLTTNARRPAAARAGMPAVVQRDTRASVAKQVRTRPEEVAADWFAAARHVARDKVRALQQQRVGATERRVLVMADAGGGKLPSAYVTVKLRASGWAVG
jgi:hypothetical protein